MVTTAQKLKLARLLNKVEPTEGLSDFAAQQIQELNRTIPVIFEESLAPHLLNFEALQNNLAILNDYLNGQIGRISEEADALSATLEGDINQLKKDIPKLIRNETKALDSILRAFFTAESNRIDKEIRKLIKKIQEDIQDLYWRRGANGSNNVQAVLSIKSNGSAIAKNVTGLNFVGATIVDNMDGTVTITVTGGGAASFVDEEDLTSQVPGTTLTLANTPVAGSVKLYRGGARQQAGIGKDYTISGATITLLTAAVSGEVLLADYRK
jgi:hypothetical protein